MDFFLKELLNTRSQNKTFFLLKKVAVINSSIIFLKVASVSGTYNFGLNVLFPITTLKRMLFISNFYRRAVSFPAAQNYSARILNVA